MILLAGVVALLLGAAQPGTGPTTGGGVPIIGGISARQAYETLQNWSAEWASDAGITSASTAILRNGQGSGWTFQVYSPGRKHLATVLINGNEVVVLKDQRIPRTQKRIDTTAWQIDSNRIIANWWNARGQTLWNSEEAHSLYLYLEHNQQNDLTWQLILLNKEGDLMDSWDAHADTGEPIQRGGTEK
ncbi:MAG: hypothetical protein JW981_08540 [Anaerolineae bacterium]|nr:hypothetical protein [Anaerolineae bacterium]